MFYVFLGNSQMCMREKYEQLRINLFGLAFFRGKKDKRRERSRDRKERSTSRKRSHKDEDRMRSKAKPTKVEKLILAL